MARKTKAEPKFHISVGGVTMSSRVGPLVTPCSQLHQYIRVLAPTLVGQDVTADWPRWDIDTQSWLIEFGDEEDDFIYVKARIYHDGRVRVLLLKRGPDKDLGPQVAGTLNYPGIRGGLRARVKNAWDRLDEAAPQIAQHILLAHKKAPT